MVCAPAPPSSSGCQAKIPECSDAAIFEAALRRKENCCCWLYMKRVVLRRYSRFEQREPDLSLFNNTCMTQAANLEQLLTVIVPRTIPRG
jgi:hypothetical protein